ncbi:MAG: delta-aminolevulinic acid dehydratase [Lentisphaerae bacterium GWF2_44_16]|nr:MAG: delta-aminolevulinic acid dehydratase [Lentisphaerae bacterium GWF2_44_16]
MNKNTGLFPDVRLRRLRSSETIRSMLAAPMPGPEKFIWPVFVVEGKNIKQPIDAMPGQFRYSVDRLVDAAGEVKNMGIKAVMLFGVLGPEHKTSDASYACRPDGIVQKAVRKLKETFSSELMIFTDVCVCEYTSHGHCGIMNEKGVVENDPSLELLAKMALSHADAGADCVAPSAMMDGQVSAIRRALDASGFTDTLLLSYSTKFASSLYGPFREAAASAPSSGNRKGYQADYLNPHAALREAFFDEAEGADMLMVKPSLFYLDIISAVRAETLLPLAAYNVSGEYSMLIASAKNGWGDLKPMVREAIAAINRAGADLIISYWANQYNQLLKD